MQQLYVDSLGKSLRPVYISKTYYDVDSVNAGKCMVVGRDLKFKWLRQWIG